MRTSLLGITLVSLVLVAQSPMVRNTPTTWVSGLQDMSTADLRLPNHSSDPGSCFAGQIELNTATGVFKGCYPANTWATLGSGGGSGTVTVVGAGNLISTALVTGGGLQTAQTAAPTATMDSSGNISTPGNLTTGAGSGVAGTIVAQRGSGTAYLGVQGASAGDFHIKTVASFTSWDWTAPTAPCAAKQWFTTDTGGVGSCTQPGTGDISDWTTSTTTLTDGATITWAIGSARVATAVVTLGGNRTLNLTGLVDTGSYVVYVIQDGTGSRGLTLGTGCTWKVGGGGAGAITPSTTAGATDVLAFIYRSSNGACYANFNKNFN